MTFKISQAVREIVICKISARCIKPLVLLLAVAEQLLSQRDATAQVLDDTAACVDHCINDVEFIRQMAKVLSKQ